MRKSVSIIVLLFLFSIKIFSQEITMTTSKAVGSTIDIYLKASSDTTVQVDYGNGVLVTETVLTEDTEVFGTTVGTQTIKIYGTGLTSLNCAYNDLTMLDVSKDTTLTELYCNGNQLTNLDVSKNTVLTYLDCFENQLTSLDVTKNSALNVLNCYLNQLTSLDVTKNTTLIRLNCPENQLTSLDVSKNTSLKLLECNSNQLTSLDVSKNKLLDYLNCSDNQLTNLDLSNNTALTILHIFNNQFKFSSLPPKQATYTFYTYNSQNLQLSKKSTTELDLSSEYSINGATTVYTVKTKGGIELAAGTDYTNNGGKITFLKIPADSVYCTMTNAEFPYLRLQTTNTWIDITTGLDANKILDFQLFVTDKNVRIVSAQNYDLMLVDIQGRVVNSSKIEIGTNEFAVQNAGVYLLKVSGNNTSSITKVFVK